LPEAIWATSDVILAGNRYLHRWTEAEGWRRATNQVKDVTALYQLQGQTYVGTYKKGVVKLSGENVEPQTEDFFCLALHGVGDGIFAIGDKSCYVHVSGSWREVNLPSVQ
jgi:hypothetical protein